MNKIKLILIFFLLFIGIGCDTLITPKNESERFINHPNFQIKPIEYTTTYPMITKINDTLYNVIIENQWQSFGRIEARFSETYPGVKCAWGAETDINATYTYLGQNFIAPIINENSYFSNGVSSTMVSFYKEFSGHMVLVGAGAASEDHSKRYYDYVYFIVSMKN